jgi:hypothetical protein
MIEVRTAAMPNSWVVEIEPSFKRPPRAEITKHVPAETGATTAMRPVERAAYSNFTPTARPNPEMAPRSKSPVEA